MKVFLLKSFILFFSVLISTGIWAQQSRFIYIQTENQQPFFVKVDNRVLSSSASGYMIIPRFKDSVYKLVIGFPQKAWPEMNFMVNLKDTNAGFLLSNINDSTWSIINLQTRETSLYTQRISKNKITEADDFAKILAEVVNDPSIALSSQPEQALPINNAAQEKKETIDTVKMHADTATAIVQMPKKRIQQDHITKLKVDSSAAGILITYVETAETEQDTVTIMIPLDSVRDETINSLNTTAVIPEKKSTTPETADARFLNMELQNPNSKKDSADTSGEDFVISDKKKNLSSEIMTTGEAEQSVSDSSGLIKRKECKIVASQNDFLELRKNMAAQKSETEMNAIAGKVFYKICFTTEQIKNLGVLFINEKEKLDFFTLAYLCVTDAGNYRMLADQFTDEYYKTKFYELLAH